MMISGDSDTGIGGGLSPTMVFVALGLACGELGDWHPATMRITAQTTPTASQSSICSQ